MPTHGFKYPSKIVSLRVLENGGRNPSEHSIHESVLLQLPYFSDMLSGVWKEDASGDISFELPPLSSVGDFNEMIESLYRGTTLPAAKTAERAVGMLVLVKMLQADHLIEAALTNIRQLTSSDGTKVKELVSTMEAYNSLEDASRLLNGSQATFDDDTLMSTIKGCRKSPHAALLSAALASRATFGLREQDLMTLLKYMNTSTPLISNIFDCVEILPILHPGKPKNRGSQEWVDKVNAAKNRNERYPLCLEATGAFESLWSVARPLIKSPTHFTEASKIFQVIASEQITCFKTQGSGSWSNSGKTHYPGSTTYHTIPPCALIVRRASGEASLHEDKKEELEKPLNPLIYALNEVLIIGVDLIKSSEMPFEDLIPLLDCASPRILDHHSDCTDKCCRLLRIPSKTSGIALEDDQLSALVASDGSIVLAKHLLNSKRWGLECLGPNTVASVQSILASR